MFNIFFFYKNTGIYIISPRAMEYVPKGEKFDFSRDLFPLLLEKGETICAFECSGYWRDVGTPEDYLACCRDVLEGRVRLPLLKGVGFEPEIPGARIIPPCFISRDCIIGEGSVIGPHAVLQGGVTLGENSRVFGSVLTGITAGAGFAAEGCIVSRGTSFGDGCCVQPGAVVGEDCEFSPYDVVDSGLHSGGEHSRNSFTVRQALEMATVSGARALGRTDTGRIAPGYVADLILVDFTAPNLTPCHDEGENLVYAAHGSNVALNMARGKVIYKDGEFLTLDLEEIKREVREYALPLIF